MVFSWFTPKGSGSSCGRVGEEALLLRYSSPRSGRLQSLMLCCMRSTSSAVRGVCLLVKRSRWKGNVSASSPL